MPPEASPSTEVSRRRRSKPTGSGLLYVILRGVTPVRVASHPMAGGAGETVAVFKFEPKLSARFADGVFTPASSLIDFEADLVAFDGAFGTRKPRGQKRVSQPELPITGTSHS